MSNSRLVLGISFLLVGVFSLLRYFGIVSISDEQLFGTVIILYSLPTVYCSLENGRREKLVWATVLFCAGVVFIVKSYFEILDTRGIVFASILFAGGAAFMLLFIENTKEKIFLLSALLLVFLSYLSVTFFKKLGLFETVNKIGNLFEVFWPVVLMLLGIVIFIHRKKKF
ncbi:hypothetical protein C0389_06285 [bacterium]|nr:hypothetical protein [bacterium]